MTIRRMEHGASWSAATAFFVALGFERWGEGAVARDWVERIIGWSASAAGRDAADALRGPS
jgi:hypothetical protein